MQKLLWYMDHRDVDVHNRSHTVCFFSTESYIQHMSFIYSSKQQCLVKTRCLEGRGAHMDECVRHDWLFWTGEGN